MATGTAKAIYSNLYLDDALFLDDVNSLVLNCNYIYSMVDKTEVCMVVTLKHDISNSDLTTTCIPFDPNTSQLLLGLLPTVFLNWVFGKYCHNKIYAFNLLLIILGSVLRLL